MTYANDMALAEMHRQGEEAAGVLSQREIAIRFQRRLLAAQRNNSGTVNSAAEALGDFGASLIVLDDSRYETSRLAYVAALAVLVADGASPTQAHVATANSAYVTFKEDLIPRTFVAADKTAHDAALATLVADAASPTQAHVTALNSAYTTFAGGIV